MFWFCWVFLIILWTSCTDDEMLSLHRKTEFCVMLKTQAFFGFFYMTIRDNMFCIPLENVKSLNSESMCFTVQYKLHQ